MTHTNIFPICYFELRTTKYEQILQIIRVTTSELEFTVVHLKDVIHQGHGSLVRQPSVGQEDDVLKLIEQAGRRLVYGANDDLPATGHFSQRVYDVCGRVTIQPGGDLVAKQNRRVVNQLDG